MPGAIEEQQQLVQQQELGVVQQQEQLQEQLELKQQVQQQQRHRAEEALAQLLSEGFEIEILRADGTRVPHSALGVG